MATLCAATTLARKPTKPMNKAQRAIFMSQLMWPVGSTIRIYIYDYSKIQIIPRSTYERYVTENENLIKQKKNPSRDLRDYMFWYDFSYVSSDDLDKYFDPLYKSVQGKVSPGQLIKSVVMERLAPLVNLKFEFTQDINDSFIRIQFDSTKGCNSLIGTDNKKASQGLALNKSKTDPTMNFAWLDVATVLHEFCHALGMQHEHQNPNNNPIQWNIPAIECFYKVKDGWDDKTVKSNIIEKLKTEETNGSNFDRASIMIYAFPKTMPEWVQGCSGNLTLNGYHTDPNYRLSNTDIQWLGYIYPMSGNRDPNFVKNLPKDVIPTDIFNPENVSDVAVQVRVFFQNNWKTIVGVIGGIIGMYILYLVVKSLTRAREQSYQPRYRLY